MVSNEAFKPKNTVSAGKHGGSSFMLWGCFAASGTIAVMYNIDQHYSINYSGGYSY